MASDNQPKLPAANEFTPGQLGGPEVVFELLQMVVDLKGDRAEVAEQVRQKWFLESAKERKDPAEREAQQLKRAHNEVTGMRQYGLLEKSTDPLVLSPLGEEILKHKGEPQEGLRIFVSFLLRKRNGLELAEVARSVWARDGFVTKKAVDAELRNRGFKVSTNSSYSGKLRRWLEAANVMDDSWKIDEQLLEDLAGVAPSELDAWRALTDEQRATLEVLRVRAEGDLTPLPSNQLLDLLDQRGVEFDKGQVKKKIYAPLKDAGWIDHEVGSSGRGGKGGLITPTQKTLDLDADFLGGLQLGDLPADLQRQLDTPTEKIIKGLGSKDAGKKGIALELLALRLASDVGLLPVELRLRGAQTGGAEVDLVAEGAHLHFSRWLFQCKNQVSKVGLSVLAKELGMATLLKAQVVVIVTTSSFAASVRDFAKQASESSAIQIILLDKSSLDSYKAKGPRALRDELHGYARQALTLKRSQLAEVPKE